jgi:hypothetical protein
MWEIDHGVLISRSMVRCERERYRADETFAGAFDSSGSE